MASAWCHLSRESGRAAAKWSGVATGGGCNAANTGLTRENAGTAPERTCIGRPRSGTMKDRPFRCFPVMTNPTEERVRALLATIIDPHTGQDLIAGGAVKG